VQVGTSRPPVGRSGYQDEGHHSLAHEPERAHLTSEASVPACRGDGAGHAWDGGAGYAEGGSAGSCRAEPLAVRPIALDPVPQAVYCSVT
jgi:hypothetical protein